MGEEKRRSDRIMLTVPLRVEWTDDKGVAFNEEARTVSINRHGARIRIARPLQCDQVLRVVNQVTRLQADFRVRGPLSPPSDKGSEWAVECLKADGNIWGIYFPPIPEGKPPDATALAECRKCHTVAVLRLTLVEGEVLETAGILSKRCEKCNQVTSWGFVEKRVDLGTPPGAAVPAGQSETQAGPPGKIVNRRRHPRVPMQVPVLIRDYYGGTEIAKSANVSKGGFCFTSDKNYQLGQGIMTTCPYNPGSPSAEVSAHIVHYRSIEGTNRKIYGVRYFNPAA